MNISIINAIIDISNMSYFQNEAAKGSSSIHGHENAVLNKLVFHTKYSVISGKNLPKQENKKFVKNWDIVKITNWLSSVKPGTIIRQPCGTQNFPDFIVKTDSGYILPIECKSAKERVTPMWNDKTPSVKNCIYIFSSKKYNKTVVFMGKDAMTEQELEISLKYDNRALELAKEANKEFEGIGSKRRKNYRPQNFEKGNPYFSNIQNLLDSVLGFLKDV